jgi:hypothetical protein
MLDTALPGGGARRPVLTQREGTAIMSDDRRPHILIAGGGYVGCTPHSVLRRYAAPQKVR